MAEWKAPIGYDPLNRVENYLIKEDGQLFHHQRRHDGPLIEENKRLATQPQKAKQSRLAARIPASCYYIDWPLEFQIRHGEHPHRVTGEKRKECRKLWRDFVTSKLNQRDYMHLRVDGGKKL